MVLQGRDTEHRQSHDSMNSTQPKKSNQSSLLSKPTTKPERSHAEPDHKTRSHKTHQHAHTKGATTKNGSTTAHSLRIDSSRGYWVGVCVGVKYILLKFVNCNMLYTKF